MYFRESEAIEIEMSLNQGRLVHYPPFQGTNKIFKLTCWITHDCLSIYNDYNSWKDMRKIFLKNKIKREIKIKIKVVRLKFAIVCEKAFGGI